MFVFHLHQSASVACVRRKRSGSFLGHKICYKFSQNFLNGLISDLRGQKPALIRAAHVLTCLQSDREAADVAGKI